MIYELYVVREGRYPLRQDDNNGGTHAIRLFMKENRVDRLELAPAKDTAMKGFYA